MAPMMIRAILGHRYADADEALFHVYAEGVDSDASEQIFVRFL